MRCTRGAYRETWRRIAQAQARLAFAATLLAAAPVAEPAAAAGDPLFRHGLLGLGTAIYNEAGLDFADLDGDGDFDLLTTGFLGTRFFENTGTAAAPAFASGQTNPFGLTSIGTSSFPSFGDLDGDGDLDLLVGRGSQSFYFENTGTASAPAFAGRVTNPFGLSTGVLELADLDGDGDLDAFQITTFLENTGSVNTPAFAAPVPNPFGLAYGSRFEDLDGDGDLDALAGAFSANSSVFLVENTGTATAPAFAAPQTTPLGLNSLGATDLVDLDGDGDFDAFTAGILYGELEVSSVFENVGGASAPAFTNLGNPFGFGGFDLYAQAGYAYPQDGGSAGLADLDGDGDLDAFVDTDPAFDLPSSSFSGTRARRALRPSPAKRSIRWL